MSSYTLNPYEQRVLEKGLSFCSDYQCKDFDLFLDLYRFTRKLTLKRHFSLKPEEESMKRKNNALKCDPETIGKRKEVKSRSKFYPVESQGPFIQVFHELVLEDLKTLSKRRGGGGNKYQKKDFETNLSKKEKGALKSLKNNNYIVIKGADKGGGVVIMNTMSKNL